MNQYIDKSKLGLTDFEIIMCHDYKEVLKLLLEKIEQASIADVEEVRHGYWTEDSIVFTDSDGVARSGLYGYKCSQCGGFCIGESKYCPNCGARMDLK